MAITAICPNCRHSRRGHSREGCGEMLADNKGWCPCRKPYMSGGWVQGEEKKEW